MSRERWMRIEQALDRLLDQPSSEWSALLDELAEGDAELAREVAGLLARDSAIRGFLESPVLTPGEAPASTPSLDGRRLGPYDVREEIARGGMGWVYRAEDTTLGRPVALKVLPPEMAADAARLARFEQEARIVATLNHPNIVTIHAIEEMDGVRFLTMELVDGTPLDRITAAGRLSLERFLGIALPLTEAVSAAHERGIVHRDLKPANVMLTAQGHLKVLDFGVAKLRGGLFQAGSPDAGQARLTDAGTILGTIDYMSPEQLQGREADFRSDLFSLGVIFFELLTGERPFSGESTAAVVGAVLRDEAPAMSRLRANLPESLERIVGRCLEKAPEQRFADACELLGRLQALRRELDAGAARPAVSIAVLPFQDMSPGKDQEYFCEGIAEELINALGRIADLRVASRTSSFKFKDAAEDIREIGRQIGVSNVLEGSVRKAGDHIRVTVQLVSAGDGYRLWSDRYDREIRDIFAIQEEIADSIVEALELTLSPRERRALRQVSTRDVEAYEYYLRGRRFFYRVSRRNFLFARQLYERAIELDPAYALAYVGLAECCAFLSQYSEQTYSNLTRADEASGLALALDPELAETHASRGLVLSLMGQRGAAEERFETASRLNPDLFEAYYFHARACQAQGDYVKAARLYERAGEVQAEDYEAPRLLLKALAGLGATTARIEAAARRALERIESRLELEPDDVRAYSFGAPCQLLLGRREKALEWSRTADDLEPDDAIILYNKACLLSLAGEHEAAMRTLEQALHGGFVHRHWVERDPELAALHGDPRFAAALDFIG